MLLMSAAIREIKANLDDAEAARFTASSSLRSAEAQLEAVNASETSLGEEMALLQSDSTRLDDQCAHAVSRSVRVPDLLGRVSEYYRTPGEILCNLLAQVDRKRATLRCECDEFQSHLSSFNSRHSASRESIRNACERLEAYRVAFISSHLRMESDLSSGRLQFLTGVARFVNQCVGAHRHFVVELDSSASMALEHEFRSIVETLCAGEEGVPYPGLILIIHLLLLLLSHQILRPRFFAFS